MKPLLLLALSSTLSLAADPPLVIPRPTIIAFCPPMTGKQMDANPDLNEVLSDFQLYAAQVRDPLQKAGIDFHQVFAASFRLRIGNKQVTFRPRGVKVGYYLIAPGKKPRIEYGVNTDIGLLQVATDYFGMLAR
jgi:hypothetical protein